jgi:hypothetical protein
MWAAGLGGCPCLDLITVVRRAWLRCARAADGLRCLVWGTAGGGELKKSRQVLSRPRLGSVTSDE